MHAEKRNAAELLGLPGDARLLILNCDDLGIYRAANVAIVEAIAEGVATTGSLMVPCPAASHAIELLRANPGVPFGIHLTFICDLAGYGWGPLSPKEAVPSLLDRNGEFFSWDQTGELMAQVRLDELERESRAQIEAVLAAELEPTHVDWHCLRDGGRDDVFELTVALAGEYGLAVRASERSTQERLKARGLPANDHPLLDSFGVEIDGKPARYAEMLHELPPGLSQWAVHPALGDDEAKAVDPDGWRVRQTDYEFLTSRGAREIVAEEQVTLLDYRHLQRVWRQVRDARLPRPMS
jgi:predicted glycoside hydrolase/deacetylase ChbG (UPF0249 family)